MTENRDRLPAATRLGRVALTVADTARVAEFYESVVGLVVHEGGEPTVLGDGETPLLELHEDDALPARPADAAGLFHTAFRVPSRAALGDALARIEAAGALDGASDHLVSEALYCTDPEGNGVEVYCDRPRGEWGETADGRVEMATEPLALADLRAAATGADRVPAGTDVGHVHLEVTSLADARAFYDGALGMTLRAAYDGGRFLAAGDYHHHVGANVWGRRTAPIEGRGLAWFELLFPDAASLEAATDRLAAAGHAAEPADGGVTVTDPDGITLRLRA
ncbi:VOC family protein [Haloarcula litorea]|uniref:VOC family protein n=1 Tax=Haloarcula litorea TaxID=3032579 RepID=UPI0023E89CDB|nr:VOC family protein [Halomicroarcula sp. GDY20]